MPSVLWKRDPIQLTFFLTRRCNSKCPFCFYLKSPDAGVGSREELSLDEIRKISGSLGNLLWLAFSGGEIYLRDDLAEISRTFHDNNKPAIMLFPTNGMLPEVIKTTTEQILRECRSSVIAVKLSIDGVGKRHDMLRATPGSFENTLETYRLLEPLLAKYPHFELGVNTVLCSENQDDMDAIIDFVSGLKSIGTHTISLIRGNLSDPHYKDVDPEKYLRAITRLEENAVQGASENLSIQGSSDKSGAGHTPAKVDLPDHAGAKTGHPVLRREVKSCVNGNRRGQALRDPRGILRECQGFWLRYEEGCQLGAGGYDPPVHKEKRMLLYP